MTMKKLFTVIIIILSSFISANACDILPQFGLKTEGLSVQFSDYSEGNIKNMEWIFGDGSISHETNPSHRYEAEGTYALSLVVTGIDGCREVFESKVHVFDTSGAEPILTDKPDSFVEHTNIANSTMENIQNYPNPVVEQTMVEFNLSKASDAKVELYDMKGGLVARLADESMDAGKHNINFAKNELPAGVYLLQLQTLQGKSTHKMVVR